MRFLILLGMMFSFTAGAEISPPDRDASFSRGFQQAKRVASLENQQDIPSRAYWLSSRLVKKVKQMASEEDRTKRKKRPVSTKN